MCLRLQCIDIGVHVHGEPARLRATLASLRDNTSLPFNLLLLPDGADAATRAALESLSDIPQLGTPDARGAAACFNRLANSSAAEVFVLLESGARVAPLWLEHLLSALDADARNGLAGPSANRCWNEQQLYPRCGDSPIPSSSSTSGTRATLGDFAVEDYSSVTFQLPSSLTSAFSNHLPSPP